MNYEIIEKSFNLSKQEMKNNKCSYLVLMFICFSAILLYGAFLVLSGHASNALAGAEANYPILSQLDSSGAVYSTLIQWHIYDINPKLAALIDKALGFLFGLIAYLAMSFSLYNFLFKDSGEKRSVLNYFIIALFVVITEFIVGLVSGLVTLPFFLPMLLDVSEGVKILFGLIGIFLGVYVWVGLYNLSVYCITPMSATRQKIFKSTKGKRGALLLLMLALYVLIFIISLILVVVAALPIALSLYGMSVFFQLSDSTIWVLSFVSLSVFGSLMTVFFQVVKSAFMCLVAKECGLIPALYTNKYNGA